MWAKKIVFIVFLLFSVNAFAHTSIRISVGGGPLYYPTPVYYGPPMMAQRVVWVPAHRERRYWVQGHYVEYTTPVAYYHRHREYWGYY